MKKILVTGADGFIGSHLVEALVKENYQVKALVLYNSFHHHGWLDTLPFDIKQNIEIIMGDIRDDAFMRHLVQSVDMILHLAALIAIPYSYLAPRQYVDTNIVGTLNILQAALQKGIPVIHTSTSEVYGSAQYVPIDETHPLNAQSPYAATKIAADQLALSFYRSFQLPISIIRPFNTFGPRQSNRAIIPTLITQFLEKRNDIQVGNLYSTRDFTYVSDTVNGFIQMIKHHENVLGEVINLGTGFEISILELIHVLEDITKNKVNINIDHQRIRPEKSEVNRLLSNPSLAKDKINWVSQIKDVESLKEHLVKTIDWFDNNLHLYKLGMYHV